MDPLNWEKDRELREEKALEEHARLHRLFKENRFAFELERKQAIEAVIQSARTEEMPKSLEEIELHWNESPTTGH